MIPATNTKVLVSEDWKKIYQSFRNADFKSYDFETLKRTMISYLQEKYPEDFNDFIDSSEYIALIDLIAYLGQNLSFRIDLNARENFLETAQRRDSILRLAQLISYNPSRNIPANGLLKITAITTTDNILDSNGINLANTSIAWNDTTNSEWYQQFISILNSAIGSKFGNPIDRKTLDGIQTEQYAVNSTNQDAPIFSFSKSISGTSMAFEVVPCAITGKESIYENPPEPAAGFSFVYRNDNQGSSSINTGFFVHFRQGTLGVSSFSIDTPVPNEIVGVNTPGINNEDVWLWQLDKNGNFSTLWTPVNYVVGSNNNIIYNSLSKNLRTTYAVSSRNEDQIDLNFSDGVFGDLPKGEFRLFYRQSNARSYVIKPEQMSGIIISIPYANASGQPHTLQLTLGLQYTVNNSLGSESNASIQLKAPQNYYIQNRMITGEDYNIAPLTVGSDVLKIKSINRISSGLSKYFDISDVSGRYSSTNIFSTDGMIYVEEKEKYFEFEFSSRNQIISVIKNTLAPIVTSAEVKSLYFQNYSAVNIANLGLTWTEVNKSADQSRGYFNNALGIYSVGSYSSTTLSYVKPGALIKFLPPFGKYFDEKNNLKNIPTTGIPAGGKSYVWANVLQVIGDGSNAGLGALSDGTGPIILSTRVPNSCIPASIIPKYNNLLNFSIETEITNICMSQNNFGLTLNNITREWDIILNSNLNLTAPFSLANQSNTEDLGLDASWIFAFVWDGKKYRVKYRTLDYVFESEKETSFYFDETSINYDYQSNTVIKDKIDVLGINSRSTSSNSLGVDYSWQVVGSVIETDGYINPKKVEISFYDFNNLGQINDPDSFKNIVEPDNISYETSYKDKFLYFKKLDDGNRYELTSELVVAYPNEDAFNTSNPNQSLIEDNSLYYFYDPSINVVKYWSTVSSSLVYTDQYFGRSGRSDLKFRYLHNTNNNRRIDPSKTNIIDLYVLTLSYDNEFRSWLLGNITDKPLPPTSYALEQNFGEKLENIKSISDEIVFHPVKYKVLFGPNADTTLQATFKAVRNTSKITTDNDLKTRILTAINDFFVLENWEFGQSFYFGELSAYVMNRLTPDITNFIIVPNSSDLTFGNLFEISCQSDELFIHGATAENIEIIDAITAAQLKITSSGS